MQIIFNIILFLTLCLFNVNAAEELAFDSILKKTDLTIKSRDKNEHHDNLNKLIKAVNVLSEREKKKLYAFLVMELDLDKKINPSNEDPFANMDEWYLIGVILSQTKDNDLIFNILVTSPPNQVAFKSLEDFLEDVPKSVLVKVLKHRAVHK